MFDPSLDRRTPWRIKLKFVWAPAACIVLALLLVVLFGAWGAYQDWQRVGADVEQTELTRIRALAERTVGAIENQLDDGGSSGELEDMAKLNWLRDYWSRMSPPDRRYRAVVNLRGLIVAHTDRSREGRSLQAAELGVEHPAAAGVKLYRTDSEALTGGRPTLDLVAPIVIHGRQIGDYHSGINLEWLGERIAVRRWVELRHWALVISGILVVVLLSSVSLYRITARAAKLERALAEANARRIGELGQLIAGLAHEIRNPLNAIRLNLFTANRVFRGDVTLDAEEVTTMLLESAREVSRVDELITMLLGYARPMPATSEPVEVGAEVESVLQFLKPTFDAAKVRVDARLPGQPVSVDVGRGRFRQILLNLLVNARDAVAPRQGVVRVDLTERNRVVELSVADNGPGISAADREHVFEPFFTTKEHGFGLGLAVARSLVESAGGAIACDASVDSGCRFVAQFAAAGAPTQPQE